MVPTLTSLIEHIEAADQILGARGAMLEPSELPGRYGRAARVVEELLQETNIPAVLGGDWAVWRYGNPRRVSEDLDVCLPQACIGTFLQSATVSGFEVLVTSPSARWPKLLHRETKIQVDIFPEGGQPGTAAKLAPTTIPSPTTMGAQSGSLRYMELPWLIVLKLAAGRARDESDVVELLRANPPW